MDSDVYQRLAQALDELPGGYPRSESGVELRILQRLFTPQEAHVACCLTLLAESAEVVARRAGLPVEETARLLEEMDRKRLIYNFSPTGATPRYMAQQFVIGLWESQVDRLDRELVELFEAYLPIYAAADLWGRVPQLRTIPVRQSIPNTATILPYEHVEAMMGKQTRFAVANCICRQEMHIIDQGCGRPMETCLVTGSMVDYYVRVGRGREITREEALALIDQANEAGLVLQAGNDQASGSLCMCCGCCCGVLRILKSYPDPANHGSSPFVAVLDESRCMGCELCLSRCPMDALTFADFHAVHHPERCIGCGLCVSTCPESALTLVRKEQQREVPKTIVHLYISMARSRKRLGPGEMVRLGARTAVDRFLAKKE